jgi:hypothetical protein
MRDSGTRTRTIRGAWITHESSLCRLRDLAGHGCHCVLSSDVGSVMLNVTMIRPAGNGFVKMYRCGDRPIASSMNAPPGGGVVANEVIAKVSGTGTVCL